MTEKNPLTAYYGGPQGIQGRLTASRVWNPSDGSYVYVLGDDSGADRFFALGSHVEISQSLDLTGVKAIRFDMGMLQPTDMPVTTDISGHYVDAVWTPTATLKLNEVLPTVYPSTATRLHQPYKLPLGGTLRVSVDGGANQDIIFPPSPAGGFSATAVRDRIAMYLTGGTASVSGASDDPTVTIASNTRGIAGSIEVKDFGPGTDANTCLLFYQKTGTPTAIYGGDSLSAIIAPDVEFDNSHIGALLEITGCVDDGNNGYNRIHAVLSEHTAVLAYALSSSEAVGFHCNIIGAMWQFCVKVDGKVAYQTRLWRGMELSSNDMAINVSKLTGAHTVMFQLELPFVEPLLGEAMAVTELVATVKS